ncbi:MAG: pyridoxal 5'-phosphate synthase glutaminase subunit PdxT [bacterium]|nr:pyridoxal 5'-phosphate synthase glutaminase subunit PdxT [bacterium]
MRNLADKTVGVLAVQGDFEQHIRQIKLVGANAREVKLPKDLAGLDALILPGGESTTMTLLIDRFNLREPLANFIRSKPVYGTCAGMILLSKRVLENQAKVQTFGAIDIDVVRNGYGRQLFSSVEEIQISLNGSLSSMAALFIRAPKVVRTGKEVRILAELDKHAVLVSEGKCLASNFHSELEGDTRLLEFFLSNFLPQTDDN